MFDRVCILNLDRRPDRWDAICEQLPQPWPFAEPERISAFDGQELAIPPAWQSGAGAYGCLLSHLYLWKQAEQQGQSLLVLEDDCVFCEDFAERTAAFLEVVPSDWQMLYFGGKHVLPPEPVAPGVVRVIGAKKTHAYAIRGEALKILPPLVLHYMFHLDVALSRLQRKCRVYAPDVWLCGQAAGKSDILNGSASEPERWWNRG